MEHIPLTSNQSEIVTRVAQAALQKKRIVLWDPPVRLWLYLAYAGLLKTLDYIVVSTNEKRVGTTLYSHNETGPVIKPPQEAKSFKPDWALLCADGASIADFCHLRDEYEFGPAQIFLPMSKWNDPLYGVRETVMSFVASIPETINGGTTFDALVCVYEGMKYIAENKIPGDIVNFGVYLGWSMYYMALIRNHFGLQDRKIIGFDTFAGFVPSDDKRDVYLAMNGRPPETNAGIQMQMVSNNLSSMANIELVQGDLQKTAERLKNGQYCLIFVDVDDYSPTRAGLAYADEHMAPGGVIVHDHYAYDTLGLRGECFGERMAMDEFLTTSHYYWLNPAGSNIFYKCSKRAA